jgi:DNA modification methylase
LIDHLLNKIYLGDALKLLLKLPDNCIDLVFTDPPYGVGFEYGKWKEPIDNADDYEEWIVPIHRHLMRVLKPNGYLLMFQGFKYHSKFRQWFGRHVRLGSTYWIFGQFRTFTEMVITQQKGNPRLLVPQGMYFGKSSDKVEGFPIAKSLPICKQLMKQYSKRGDIVLDCFAGSGTIPLAALLTGRRFLACELIPQFVDIANSRIYVRK